MEKIGADAYSLNVNAHCALLTGGRLLLIDTGTEQTAENLLEEIKKTGYHAKDIEYIVLTHTHPDHIGGLATMKDITGARIASHEIEAKFIAKQDVYDGPPGKQTQKHPGTQVDDLLRNGDVYQGVAVIHTPGHTPGHISLLETESNLLIAGDSFRTENNACFPMPDQYNSDPHQHRLSMKKLTEFDFSKIIVGHGDPVHAHGQTLLSQAVNDLKLEKK